MKIKILLIAFALLTLFQTAASSVQAATVNGNCGDDKIDTAIGCIPFGNNAALAGFFLGWGIGIGGGIAFILIVFAAFQIMTSAGDPKKLMAGQELLTSALAGLIMLIFAGFILKMLGADIFGIPGL